MATAESRGSQILQEPLWGKGTVVPFPCCNGTGQATGLLASALLFAGAEEEAIQPCSLTPMPRTSSKSCLWFGPHSIHPLHWNTFPASPNRLHHWQVTNSLPTGDQCSLLSVHSRHCHGIAPAPAEMACHQCWRCFKDASVTVAWVV